MFYNLIRCQTESGTLKRKAVSGKTSKSIKTMVQRTQIGLRLLGLISEVPYAEEVPVGVEEEEEEEEGEVPDQVQIDLSVLQSPNLHNLLLRRHPLQLLPLLLIPPKPR